VYYNHFPDIIIYLGHDQTTPTYHTLYQYLDNIAYCNNSLQNSCKRIY